MEGGEGLFVHFVTRLRAAFFEQTQGHTQRVRPSERDQIKKQDFVVGIIMEALFEASKVLKFGKSNSWHKLWKSCERVINLNCGDVNNLTGFSWKTTDAMLETHDPLILPLAY